MQNRDFEKLEEKVNAVNTELQLLREENLTLKKREHELSHEL
jgi:hypothetical protein